MSFIHQFFSQGGFGPRTLVSQMFESWFEEFFKDIVPFFLGTRLAVGKWHDHIASLLDDATWARYGHVSSSLDRYFARSGIKLQRS